MNSKTKLTKQQEQQQNEQKNNLLPISGKRKSQGLNKKESFK